MKKPLLALVIFSSSLFSGIFIDQNDAEAITLNFFLHLKSKCNEEDFSSEFCRENFLIIDFISDERSKLNLKPRAEFRKVDGLLVQLALMSRDAIQREEYFSKLTELDDKYPLLNFMKAGRSTIDINLKGVNKSLPIIAQLSEANGNYIFLDIDGTITPSPKPGKKKAHYSLEKFDTASSLINLLDLGFKLSFLTGSDHKSSIKRIAPLLNTKERCEKFTPLISLSSNQGATLFNFTSAFFEGKCKLIEIGQDLLPFLENFDDYFEAITKNNPEFFFFGDSPLGNDFHVFNLFPENSFEVHYDGGNNKIKTGEALDKPMLQYK